MKKIITLIVVLGLVLGLTVPAWAADETDWINTITSEKTLTELIGHDSSVKITGSIPPDVAGGVANSTKIEYKLSSNVGTPVANHTTGAFEMNVLASTLYNTAVTFTLKKDVTQYDESGTEGMKQTNIEAAIPFHTYGTFNIAPKNEMTAANLNVTCSGSHAFSLPTGSGTSGDPFLYTIPQACVTAKNTITVATKNLDAKLTVDSISTVNAEDNNTIRVIRISNGTSDTPKEYAVKFVHETTGPVTLATTINLRTTTTDSGTTLATLSNLTSTTGTQTMTIPTSEASTTDFYAHFTLGSGITITDATFPTGTKPTITGGRIGPLTMQTTVNTRDLVVTFSTGDVKTITINRATASPTLVSSVHISTSATSTTSSYSVVNYTTAITTTSATPTITIPTSFTAATFYAHLTLPSDVTLSSVSGTNVTRNGNVLTITSFSTSASSRNITLYLVRGSSTYTKTITIERGSSGTTLANGINIRTGSSSSSESAVNYTTTVTTTSSTPTISIPNDYSGNSTFYAHVSMPSGVTLKSASFGGSSATINSGNVVTLSLSTSTNTRSLTLVFTLNNTDYTKYFTIEREQEAPREVSLNSLSVRSSSSSSSSTYSLSPSFSYSRTKYDVEVPRSLSEVYVHISAYGSSTISSVSNSTLVSTGVYRVTLSSGQRTVTIRVRGSGSNSSVYTEYTLNIGGSTKARLSSLRAADRNSPSSSNYYTFVPSFSSSITEYTVLIPYDGSSRDIYVQGTLNNSGDTLKIDGSNATSGHWVHYDTINADRTKSVTVRVEDNDNNRTDYSLNFIAARSGASSDANLRDLYLRSGSSGSNSISFNSSFSSGTTSYTAESVANDVSTVRVYAEGYNNPAAIVVNDVLVSGGYATVNLSEGNNTLRVTVYAENCSSSKAYTISINRGAAGSSDSTLSGLQVRTPNQTLNLIPAFDKNTLSYTTNVSDDVTQISFLPTATDSGAVIRLMGSTVTNGQWTGYNALNSGSNTFTFTVTSGDGSSTSMYSVTVARGLGVVVSTWQFRVNGAAVVSAAYNINGNNYFKLRDIAYSLIGTPKHFNVTYNALTRVVSMISNQDYVPIGGEMIRPGEHKKCVLSNQIMMVDNTNRNLTAYNIDGNNYFMLREIGALFNFGVTYNEVTRYVDINTPAT